jgi:RecA-family ATPase
MADNSILDRMAEELAAKIGVADSKLPQVKLTPISLEELENSRLTPRVILRDLLYADVRIRAAAGGTGKTTLALFEAVTLALGRELWGRAVDRPRKTVLVTREDGREILTARMREIMRAMNLTPSEVQAVLSRVNILDVSGIRFRLSTIENDLVEPNLENIEQLIKALSDFAPDWVIFDPLVSFGVGEGRVNDAEQGIIEAFRVLRNRLNCCIEGIHHVGKQNARDKVADQYAARGGSALPDGSRMMAIMNPLTPEEWQKETGTRLAHDEDGIVMALPKLSFSKPQDPIFIKRSGFLYEQATVIRRTKEQVQNSVAEQVYQFILNEYQQGRRYSSADLDNSKEKMSLTRNAIREAITALKVEGRVMYVGEKGKSGCHWQPVTLANDNGDTQASDVDFSALLDRPSPS